MTRTCVMCPNCQSWLSWSHETLLPATRATWHVIHVMTVVTAIKTSPGASWGWPGEGLQQEGGWKVLYHNKKIDMGLEYFLQLFFQLKRFSLEMFFLWKWRFDIWFFYYLYRMWFITSVWKTGAGGNDSYNLSMKG